MLGGLLRVKALAKSVNVTGNVAVLKLKCVAARCEPRGPAQGRQVARRQVVRDEARQDEDVRIKLKKRGRKMLAKASGSSLKVQLRIDAEDSKGNGWRTTNRIKLKG